MRNMRVTLSLSVADEISNSDIEEYFEGLEEDMQENFMEMSYRENDGIYIEDVKANELSNLF